MRTAGTILFLLMLSIAAPGAPMPQLPTSPTPLVTIRPATTENLPQLDSVQVRRLHPNAFLLANESDKAIVGLMTRWTFIDRDGYSRTEDVYTDSFMQPRSPVLLAAHARLIAAPGGFLPEGLAQKPHAGARLEDLDGRMSHDIAGATQIRVQIDVVVFEDGEIVGPNEARYDTFIQNRKIAAAQIAKQMRNALASSDDPRVTLRNILETSPAQSDSMAIATHIYARMLLQAPSLEKTVQSLEALPEPPKFYRK